MTPVWTVGSMEAIAGMVIAWPMAAPTDVMSYIKSVMTACTYAPLPVKLIRQIFDPSLEFRVHLCAHR